ncbi:MAG: HipA family kinase [Bacillus sp. (in: firmicutes)]
MIIKSTLRPIKLIDSINEEGKSKIAQSDPQILLLSDNKRYIIKFKNNPQGNQMLMREMVCTTLAAHLGLPTVPFEIVDIPEEFLLQNELKKYNFAPGHQFASLYIENSMGLWFKTEKEQIVNRSILAGILIFDFWLRNIDRDESNILLSPMGESKYFINMIDHGNCYPSKKELEKMLTEPGKLKLSNVHKWCLSMLNDEIELTFFLQKVMKTPDSFIVELIDSTPADWFIPEEIKKELLKDILEAKQVLADIVEVLSSYINPSNHST